MLLNPADRLAGVPPCTDVLLVAGESEAIVNGLLASDLPTHLVASDSGIKVWNGSSFVTLTNGTNNSGLCVGGSSSQNWGPEAEFAYQYRLISSQTLYIVKLGASGTILDVNSSGTDWNAGSTGKLFDQMTTYATGAMSALSGVTPKARVSWVLWQQGVNDAADNTHANNYATNLAAFLAKVKTTWGDSATRVIIGRMPNLSASTFRAAVRAAQVSQAGFAWVDTDSFPLQGDGVHFNGTGAVDLGLAMFNVR